MTMIEVNIAEAKAKLSHYLKLVKGGEKVVICDRYKPVAELTAVQKPVDRERRRAAFGMFEGMVDPEMLRQALRPMTDEEADAFIEGREW